jgi:hypothetical protein
VQVWGVRLLPSLLSLTLLTRPSLGEANAEGWSAREMKRSARKGGGGRGVIKKDQDLEREESHGLSAPAGFYHRVHSARDDARVEAAGCALARCSDPRAAKGRGRVCLRMRGRVSRAAKVRGDSAGITPF